MAKFSVYLEVGIGVVTDAETPEDAARFARERVLGGLREMPSEFVSIGFQPEHHWQVRKGDSRVERLSDIVANGVDNDLSPR